MATPWTQITGAIPGDIENTGELGPDDPGRPGDFAGPGLLT